MNGNNNINSNENDQTILAMSDKEQHKYITKYPLERELEYLVIGTIHPSTKPIFEYYYGNIGSFWKIIESIYPTYSFDTPEHIRVWQADFKIGITDTIIQCKRKSLSALDSDLIIEEEDYNWGLKEYVLSNKGKLKGLLFTSGNSKNAAFKNFKKIMGADFKQIEEKCIVLPSPSGSSTLSFFKGKNDQYGLIIPFYNFLKENYPEVLAKAKQTYELKQITKEKVKRLPDSEINYYEVYKVFEYKKHLPTKS